MKPEISVIVPVFNTKEYLERCIESILHETFPCFEMILVDDGSTDGSGEICDNYQCKYDSIRVIHKGNAGPGLARNSGIDVAEGKYIFFIDSDDYISSDCLQKLYEAAERNEADCVIAGFTVLYSNGNKTPLPCVPQEQRFVGEDGMRELLLGSVGALPGSKQDVLYGQTACARLYRKQLFMEHQIKFVSEREHISEDILFNVDFFRFAHCAVAVPDVPYYYDCTRVGSRSKQHRSDRFQSELTLKRALEERLDQILARDIYKLYLQRLVIIRVAYDITQEVLYHDHVDKGYPMKAAIKTILTDREFYGILQKYPWWELPFLRRVLVGTMRFQRVGLLIFLIRVQQHLMSSTQNI